MRTRPLLLLTATLLLGLAAAALLLDDRPASGAAVGRRTLPESGARTAEVPASLDELAAPEDRAERSDAPVAVAAPRDEAPADENSAETRGLVALRGWVRRAEDKTPAAGMELAVRFGGDAILVRTNEKGLYRTDEVVPPGVVEFWHSSSGSSGKYPAQLRLEPRQLTVPDGAESPVEHDMKLVSPDVWVDVEVVRQGNRPAEGATVTLERFAPDRGGQRQHRIQRATSDANGRARLAVYDDFGTRAVVLVARLEEGPRMLVSPPRRFENSLRSIWSSSPWRLVLDKEAVIDVRVATRGGTPVRDEPVAVDDGTDLTWWTGPRIVTDERGEARFTGLPAGTYRVRLLEEPEVPADAVTLVAGGRGEADFTAPENDQQLAASGRLVDEDGAPLPERSVTVRCVETGETVWAATDASGEFEAYAAPCATVRVSASRGVYADVFEPDELEASFGATDLVLRRTRDVANEEVLFDVVNARTGALVPDVLVLTYRAPRTGDVAFHRARDGRAGPRCPIDPSTTLVVGAPGYRRTSLTLEDLLERDDPVRVLLEPGALRTLLVRDADGAPIAGARVLDAGRLLGSTDGEGRFVVDLVEALEGPLSIAYEALEAHWNPGDGAADVGPAVVVLEAGD
ncbi:MAG: hypothetical protein AAGI22_05565 [Planctomycetota bacterium]